MNIRSLFLFLHFPTWEFHAVETVDSDTALIHCLEEKQWKPERIIYLGAMEGHLPPKHTGHSLIEARPDRLNAGSTFFSFPGEPPLKTLQEFPRGNPQHSR